MDMNIFFQENILWPILIIINTLKWRLFDCALTQERTGTVFGGMQPEARESASRKKRHLSFYHVYSAALASIVVNRAL